MGFALLKEPADYQITVHYNNYSLAFAHSGQLGRSFTKDFEVMKQNFHNPIYQKIYPVMYNLINYYGTGKIEMWLYTFILRKTA